MSSVRERLQSGAPLGGFLNLTPSPVATRALAAAGADVVTIDTEHGPIGPESLHAMAAATAGTRSSPWVRVPGCAPACVKTALDAGAEGIVFPVVTTAESQAHPELLSPVLIYDRQFGPILMRADRPAEAYPHQGRLPHAPTSGPRASRP